MLASSVESSSLRPLPHGSLSQRLMSGGGVCGDGTALDACFIASSSPPASAPRGCSAVPARTCTVRACVSASPSPPQPTLDQNKSVFPCVGRRGGISVSPSVSVVGILAPS